MSNVSEKYQDLHESSLSCNSVENALETEKNFEEIVNYDNHVGRTLHYSKSL